MPRAVNLPNYDAIIKSDPTLYPVPPEIGSHCQIALTQALREQYAPLVDEIGYDTLLPSLELAFAKVLRQWSDLRDESASIQALYEASAKMVAPDVKQRLDQIMAVYHGVKRSIQTEQVELEAVLRVAAAIVKEYLRKEPLRPNETILWLGNAAIFQTLDYLQTQLGYIKAQLFEASWTSEGIPEPSGIAFCLPLSAASAAWFEQNYDAAAKVLKDAGFKERLTFMEELKGADLDGFLRGLAEQYGLIRIVGAGAPLRILEWRLQNLGPAAAKFVNVSLHTGLVDPRERRLLERDDAAGRVLADANILGQLSRMVEATCGLPVYLDPEAPRVYLSEYQTLIWERLRLTLIKVILAQSRGRLGITVDGQIKAEETICMKISTHAPAKPFSILVAGEMNLFACVMFLLIREYLVNNGLDQLARVNFATVSDETINENTVVEDFDKVFRFFDSIGINVALNLIDRGIDKIPRVSPETVNGLDLILVDQDQAELECRNLLYSAYRHNEDRPVVLNFKTLVFNHKLPDYGPFLLSYDCLEIARRTLDDYVLSALRKLFNPMARVLFYNRKRFGQEAQDNARDDIRSWAENSLDPNYIRIRPPQNKGGR